MRTIEEIKAEMDRLESLMYTSLSSLSVETEW